MILDILGLSPTVKELVLVRTQRHWVQRWLPGAEGQGDGGHGGQRVETSRYKVNEFWGLNEHKVIILNIVLYTLMLQRE